MTEAYDFDAMSTAQVADACGVTSPAVDRWRDAIPESDGIWIAVEPEGKGKNGARKVIKWRLPKLIDWRLARAAENSKARESSSAPTTDLEREQYRKVKLANDQRAGLLVDRALMERQWAKVGADLRQRLETIGRRHGATVANELARALDELKRQVHGVLGDPGHE